MDAKQRFSWSGLIPQLFILVILPLTALLLAVTFGGLALHRQSMRILVGQRDERAARAAAQAVTDQLNQRAGEIRQLALGISMQPSPQDLSRQLRRNDFLLGYFDHGLAIFAVDGRVLASIGSVEDWKNLVGQQNPFRLDGMDPSGPPVLSMTKLESGAELIFAAQPVAAEGPVVIGAFSPQLLLKKTLEDIFNAEEGGSAFVISADKQLLFSTGVQIEGSAQASHPGVEAALQGYSGSTFMQTGSNEHVVAYSPVAPVGWALVIEEPWASVTSPLLRATEYAPLVLIPVLVLAIIALWFVTRWILQPLKGLELRANELSWGNYEAIESSTGGIEEIRHLQAALVHLAHKVKTYQQGLRSYIGAITMGQEEERRRLARELHDDTLQSMIALNQRVQLVQLAADEKAEQNGLVEIQSLTEQTIQNLRRLTRALRPIYLEDLGLAAALEMLAREMQPASGMEIMFERTGKEVRLTPPVELALYRIGQEALSNAVRHAQATQARISIQYRPDSVTLEVSDNGIGFELPESPAEFAPSGHFGLLGIYERTEMIGAKLDIRSSPNQGSRISVTVDIKVEENR